MGLISGWSSGASGLIPSPEKEDWQMKSISAVKMRTTLLLTSTFLAFALASACGGMPDGDVKESRAATQPGTGVALAPPVAQPPQGGAKLDSCGPGNCAGCCDGSGICRTGMTNGFCGQGGEFCDRCGPSDGTTCKLCSGEWVCATSGDPACQ
jgi:hypothetical protein